MYNLYAKYQTTSVKALVQVDLTFFFQIRLLYANVQSVYIVYVKWQADLAKTVVRIDIPAYALSMH